MIESSINSRILQSNPAHDQIIRCGVLTSVFACLENSFSFIERLFLASARVELSRNVMPGLVEHVLSFFPTGGVWGQVRTFAELPQPVSIIVPSPAASHAEVWSFI